MINFKKLLALITLINIASCQFDKQQNYNEVKDKENIIKENLDQKKPNQQNDEVKKLEAQNLPLPINNKFDNKFVKGTNDVPLAPNLTLINNEDIDFDSIGGSFSSSTYQSKQALNLVKNFYLENLPKLGWRQKDNKSKDNKFNFKGNSKPNSNINLGGNSLIFLRDSQKLTIELNSQNDNVVFTLTID